MLGISLRCPGLVEPSGLSDLSSSLSRYLSSNYSPAELQSVQSSLTTLSTTRRDAFQSINTNSADAPRSIELLLQYYTLLSYLSFRFPFNTLQQSSLLGLKMGKVPSVRCQFTWFDSFKLTNKLSDFDVNFEKSSILFNVAAFYSRQATYVKSQSSGGGAVGGEDNTLKDACRLFLTSSGVFHYLSAHPALLGTVASSSIDFSSEGLLLLSKLMLSQGQACIFEKSTSSLSPKLVARLAMGVAELFGQAAAEAGKGRISQLSTSKDSYNWLYHCSYQKNCYVAAAHYWLAKSYQQEEKWGEEIAHLLRAKNIASGIVKMEEKLLKSLIENRVKLHDAISRRIGDATKDNDTIYYAQVPNDASLKDPEALINVKMVDFIPPLGDGSSGNNNMSDPFSSLVAPEIRQIAEELRIKLSEFVSTQDRQVEERKNFSLMHLASLNLPQSLDAINAPQEGLPTDLWNSIADIQKGNLSAFDQLNEMNGRINVHVNECESEFKSMEELLQKEESHDKLMREKFQAKWTRKSSPEMNSTLKREMDAIRNFLNEAEASNRKVRSEMGENADRLIILNQSKAQLESSLPKLGLMAKTQESESLRSLLDEMSKLIEERSAAKGRLAAEVKAFDPIQFTLLQKGKTTDMIFNLAMANFNDSLQIIERLSQRETKLQEEITINNKKFELLISQNDIAKQRNQLIGEINQSIQIFSKLSANFVEGIKFYGELKAQRVVPLKSRILQFVDSREFEARMLMEQTIHSIAFSSGPMQDSTASSSPSPSSSSSSPSPSSSFSTAAMYNSLPPMNPAFSPSAPPPSSSPAPSLSPIAYQPNPQMYQPTNPFSVMPSPSSTSSNPFASASPFSPSTSSSSSSSSFPPSSSSSCRECNSLGTPISYDHYHCSSCSLINGGALTKCSVCGTARPNKK